MEAIVSGLEHTKKPDLLMRTRSQRTAHGVPVGLKVWLQHEGLGEAEKTLDVPLWAQVLRRAPAGKVCSRLG